MKRLLAGLFGLLMVTTVHGANPSFSSFDQVWFTTNNRVVSFRSNSLPEIAVTNLYVTNLYTSNLFSTNIFTTNLYATNIYVNTNIVINTNITINGTNVLTYADQIWTNIAGVVQPVVGSSVRTTNHTAYQLLSTTGAFSMTGTSDTNIVVGANNLNPYQVSTLQIRGASATPTDSTISLSGGNGPGQVIFIENYTDGLGFCITNNTPLWDNPANTIKLSNGDWCPTLQGESMLLRNDNHGDWVEVSRQLSQTNVFNDFITTNLTVVSNITFHGKTIINDIVNVTTNIYINGTNVPTVNPTIPYIPYKNGSNSFGDSALVHIDSVSVGVGTATNILFSNSSNLIYTNSLVSGIGPFFQVYDGSGYGIAVGPRGLASSIDAVGSSTYVQLRDSSGNTVKWLGGRWLPSSTGLSIGGAGDGNAWFDIVYDGTLYGYGWIVGTNYVRYSINHSGTNGVISLLSEATAPAGVARPFTVNRNLGAVLTTGDTEFVDMFMPSQTNAVTAAITFAHATNGIDLIEFTHVRTFYNGSGSDWLVTLNATWKNPDGASFTSTNGGIVKLYVNSMGATSTSALQTNVITQIKFVQ